MSMENVLYTFVEDDPQISSGEATLKIKRETIYNWKKPIDWFYEEVWIDMFYDKDWYAYEVSWGRDWMFEEFDLFRLYSDEDVKTLIWQLEWVLNKKTICETWKN